MDGSLDSKRSEQQKRLKFPMLLAWQEVPVLADDHRRTKTIIATTSLVIPDPELSVFELESTPQAFGIDSRLTLSEEFVIVRNAKFRAPDPAK